MSRAESILSPLFNSRDSRNLFRNRSRGDSRCFPNFIGVGKPVRSPLENEAELAVSVSDVLQRQGIGLAIVKELVEFARHEKLERITAFVLLNNRGMRAVLERVGFTFPSNSNSGVLEAELNLLRVS
jgi:RimJ/RimL family protein N-acetyltransferase